MSSNKNASLPEEARGMLLAYMKKEGLFQETFAKRIGVSRSSLGRAIRGSDISLNNQEKIMKFLKESLGFSGEGSAVVFPSEEALERAEQVKLKLLLLHHDLVYFLKADASARNILRSALSEGDVSFVRTLLGAIFGGEELLERWKRFTSYVFKSFKGE